MELTQLFRIDRRRRPSHEIHCVCGLRERDNLTNRRLAAEEGDDTVEPERDSAVGRRPVLERLEEETEPLPRFLFSDPEGAEDARLDRRAVDTGAAAADLRRVWDQVV